MTEKEILNRIYENPFILTYFSRPDCTVCKTLRPKVEKLIAVSTDIEFQYIDIQSCPLLRGQFMIFAVPTIVLFMKGKEVKRWSRFLSVQQIELELDHIRERIHG